MTDPKALLKFVQTFGIPGTHNHGAIIWLVLDLVNDTPKLVDTLTAVVRVHVFILSSKVAPLEPVHRPKVTCNTFKVVNSIYIL